MDYERKNWYFNTTNVKLNLMVLMNRFLKIFVLPLILLLSLSSCDNSNEAYEKALAAHENELRHQEQIVEMNRIDSLEFYKNKADSLLKINKLKDGVSLLDSALNFAKTSDETDIIKLRVVHLVSLKEYEAAIKDYSNLIERENDNVDYLYERAICYKHLNEIQLAVDDLKESIKLGNHEAEKLHDKINPVKKKIIRYITRCCDGSTSNATGRGACSHHGGVCDWNEPVYQEYRKY